MNSAKFNSWLIVLLIFMPIVNNLTIVGEINIPILSYLNEIIYMCLFCFVLIRYAQKLKLTKQSLFAIFIFLYFLFQIYYLRLPFSSFIQLFLYLQAPIYYLYFNELTEENKIKTIRHITTGFQIINYIVIGVALIEFVNPKFISNITHLASNSRGLFGSFIIGSIFGSPTSLSHFCIISVVYYFINRFYYNKVVYSNLTVFLLATVTFFTFSRKEMLLFIFLLFISLYIVKNEKIVFRKLVIPSFFLLALFFLYLTTFFKKANEIALSDTYVRTEMLFLSYEIIKDYFPFGTGLGTFGSQMSLHNPTIYDKYNVGTNIIGTAEERGPIYDLFLPTFTAELGIGVIFFFAFFFYMWRKKTIADSNGLNFIKYFAITAIFINGIFAPVLMTSFGLILIATLGLITKKVFIIERRIEDFE